MNRDIHTFETSVGVNIHHVGEQPRKSLSRKNKKLQKFGREFDDMERDRHTYKRDHNKDWVSEYLYN